MLRNLTTSGFAGALYLVNPNHSTLSGMKVYADAMRLPSPPDLAVIAVPPDRVADVVRSFASIGTKAAVIITAGFSELGERGAALQRDIVASAQPNLRIVGPNCVGTIVPSIGLNASFSHLTPRKGDLAFVSQSGALVTAVLDWAQPRGIGFSRVVSLGDMADVDFGDTLQYLAQDSETRAILLYVEGITAAKKFLAAASAASQSKPVIVIKAGRHTEAAKAARSHTGALAGSDAVYDAAFRRAGLLRVQSLPEMFDAIETLGLTNPQCGDRLLILTNGGGPGVIATDALISAGGKLAQPAAETIEKLNRLLPSTWSHGNPVDMIGDASPQEYSQTLEVLLGDSESDAFLIIDCPTALNDPKEAALSVIETIARARAHGEQRNFFTAWLGEYSAANPRALFANAKIPTYETPEDAIAGFTHCVRYRHNQEHVAREPATIDITPDTAAVRATIETAAAAGRRWLDADEVQRILDAYEIRTVESCSVVDAAAAADAAKKLGVPVALKLRSPDIVHKSDVGAVALGLETPEDVLSAALAMLQRVKAACPEARIEGFYVQEMVDRPSAIELIAGTSVDPIFGPIVLFGHGGVAVQVIADTSLELPPLDITIARAQIARTRVSRLLEGYRNHPPVKIDAVAATLMRIGHLAIAHPEIMELDINPLLADEQGAIALDTRIAIAAH